MEQITITLPTDLLSTVRRMAERDDRSISSQCRRLIAEGVDRHARERHEAEIRQ